MGLGFEKNRQLIALSLNFPLIYALISSLGHMLLVDISQYLLWNRVNSASFNNIYHNQDFLLGNAHNFFKICLNMAECERDNSTAIYCSRRKASSEMSEQVCVTIYISALSSQ